MEFSKTNGFAVTAKKKDMILGLLKSNPIQLWDENCYHKLMLYYFHDKKGCGPIIMGILINIAINNIMF